MQRLKTKDMAGHQCLVDVFFHQQASYWAELYEREGIQEAIHQERLRAALAMVDTLQLLPEARVLDVGGGAGYATVALASRGFMVDALDPLRVMVDTTRNRAIEAGVNSRVATRIGDVHAIPSSDDAFELVLALGVLPWLPEASKPLREMARVIRPGGHLIVSVDNLWQLRHFLDPLRSPLLGRPRRLMGDILRAWGWLPPRVRSQLTSLRTFRQLLAAEGFEELHGVALGFGPFTFFNREILPRSASLKLQHWLQSLANRGSPILRSHGSQHLVLEQKRVVTGNT